VATAGTAGQSSVTPAPAGTVPRIRVCKWLVIALVAVVLLKVGEQSALRAGYSWGLLEELSMYPRVKDLDFWVAKTQPVPDFRRGDLALFDCEGDRLIKEVIALESDRVLVANTRNASGLPLTSIVVNGQRITDRKQPFLWLTMTGETHLGQATVVPQGKIALAPVNKIAGERRLYLVERANATKVVYNCSFLPESVVTWWRCRQGSSVQYIAAAKGKDAS